jgi:Family of unknown function (DUF5939)
LCKSLLLASAFAACYHDRQVPAIVAAAGSLGRRQWATIGPRWSGGPRDERLAALEAARAWSPRVVSKLESHIRSADDVALFRINPIRFAAEKNIAEAETIDLFLHGAAPGLFEMDWLLLCPACSTARCVGPTWRRRSTTISQ